MKLCSKIITSLILLSINHLWARDIILITHEQNLERALFIKELMIRQEKIPDKFIEIRETSAPCLGKSFALLWLCFDQENQLQVVKQSPLIANGIWKSFKESE